MDGPQRGERNLPVWGGGSRLSGGWFGRGLALPRAGCCQSAHPYSGPCGAYGVARGGKAMPTAAGPRGVSHRLCGKPRPQENGGGTGHPVARGAGSAGADAPTSFSEMLAALRRAAWQERFSCRSSFEAELRRNPEAPARGGERRDAGGLLEPRPHGGQTGAERSRAR